MPRVAAAKDGAMVRKAPPRRKVPPRQKATLARAVGTYSGRGDYTYDKPGPWGKFGRYVGSAVGARYAGLGGAKVGEKLGSYLHYIGKIFGSGDYVTSSAQVKSNVLVNEGQIPQFGASSNQVRIKHREYLGDVITSGTAGAFQLTEYAINPGLLSSFPWLSQVCGASFQQYRINGMVFEFRSMSADALNSTNTALGSVVMATDYDSKDASFTTKQQMENTEFGVSCKPSSCMIHAIECARTQTSVSELYIRSAAVPSGADIRLYDMGRFSIATTGFQGTSVNCGELWVSYDISLFKAIQIPAMGTAPMYHLMLDASDATKPLLEKSTQPTGYIFDTLGCSINTAKTVLTLPLGMPVGSYFMALYCIRGSSTASVVAPTITPSQGVAYLGLSITNSSSGFNAPQTATGTTLMVMYTFRYDGTGTPAAPPILTFSGGATFPTAANGDLFILPVNGTIPHQAY